MAKPEQRFWKWLEKRIASPHFMFDRIENKARPDMPDVAYSFDVQIDRGHGWVELKVTDYDMDRDKDRVFNIKHFTPGQKAWLKTRGRLAGRCWLLVKTDTHILIFDHVSVVCVGSMSRDQAMHIAQGVWPLKSFRGEDLLRVLAR